MSTYTSQEDKVILKNDDKITSINLDNNPNLKVLIIDNLSNLETVNIAVTDGLYVSISNCVNLITISDTHRYLNKNRYGSYFYLGENLKSLKHIELFFFKMIKMADGIYNNLKSICFVYIDNLICNFKNFPKLKSLTIPHVSTQELIINSNIMKNLTISDCSIDNIEILGKCHIYKFVFVNNKYKSLKIENPIKSASLSLYDNNKTVSYIPLSDEIDKTLLNIDKDNIYDSEYKFFIERNISKLGICNYRTSEKITLDDIKFDIPQKKCARK